ncbi:ATP-dependent Clp protease ATP-binding subunit [Leuconostoc mesenteroides]|uniref:ATP-binding subunit of Clp protease and DnaK/DnaJ chaperones n=1 Tax=Leuconostoc mesenteroides subsp. mesenteroides (strain ATCC 8293 / DSM 20343 / BCRC 11652 / CCM 1803 / JCM 6124 / NCDO 523 / NBRC 100496 / NCIMB 8023 / NCTC 12954 / NRRL B-1118 / 37Y) TaxID=203120 RepID=Q03YN7_LEUMM|nr:ATP-dependent Clp protease ATP-binding subunit [Leuconostoc mesenteroides]ABJ61685.1 ATP-binding subunit of Clp protease and DnaK/DnaJ chaperones [Leuconostoc mesenteroides subsp. mesenteroides ATCC 8293]MCT3041953.1 ATP-dependent Clp protease ATP-binding subunit [Leuconostoc mesenteroides]MCU4665299.1 ATP-dependent Clp protease ATP-binding subunit [Leuconostoc mesenteroides]MDG9745927.1 ATP-dependent Clp protease ATP-binding subunit [Leuconostoc mesenteroides]PND42435.1 Clp protease ClpE [
MAQQDSFGFGNLDEMFRAMNEQMAQAQGQQNTQAQKNNNGNKKRRLLDEFGINLTKQARDGKLDPVIGRDNEVARTIEILNRRTKNNPVLIGEPGVGKTAIVEGLAQAIVAGKVPEKLQHKEVIRLEMSALVQGTSMRGQFEARMRELMKEVTNSDDVILFIDEIHEIMGAGNAEGGMDAGNILKPALARGEFQLIGATTLNEYRKIEKDGAIARRFQPVQVEEPSKEETITILEGISERYEKYHYVTFSDSALQAAVELSDRYIPERFLPDKAIDLLDEAGSRKNLTMKVADPKTIQVNIEAADKLKQEAIDKEDFEKASYWRDQVNQLESQKAQVEAHPEMSKPQTVTEQDILKIVEDKTDIPVGALKENEANQLKDLDKNLSKHVIGQDEAVEKLAKAIRRNRIGLTKSGRPIGSFLFVGPTGVGKTETAKQLAKEMFGSKDAMIRFDMSEYMEKHTVSKMIGAPAGYVGYEEAGQLTEQVRRRPYSLVLFDEVEKAHPDVMNMFLQILDDGRLTDAQGHIVSFKDTVIIMTSNAGSTDTGNTPVGFAQVDQQNRLMQRLENYFRPEFLNRLDDIIDFQPLSQDHLLKIVDLLLTDMNENLSDNDLHIDLSTAAKQKLVELGYDPAMGARPLRRVMQDKIADGIADFYLEHPDVHHLQADIVHNEFVISEVKPEPVTVNKI